MVLVVNICAFVEAAIPVAARHQWNFIMRIVHTSDWHLGRSFGPVSLHDDRVAFCKEFVGIVKDQADLVVIAGDIFDRAVAPTNRSSCSDDVARLEVRRDRRSDLGNHDGADRLSPYDDLLDGSGVYVRGGYEELDGFFSEFDDGPLDLVLPFLNPMAAPDDDPDRTVEKPRTQCPSNPP